MRPLRALLLGLLLAAGCASAADAPSPFPTATGGVFEVTCHYACGAAAAQAMATARRAGEGVASLLGPLERRPLRIHLHEAAQFAAVSGRHAQGRFARNLGFTLAEEGAAYVGVEEGDTTLRAPALRRVAHEAAHLAAAAAVGGRLPPWLAEGLATRVEREVAALDADLPSRFHDPWLALHAWRALRLLDGGELPDVPRILADTLPLAAGDAYAVHSIFFEFMRERRWETLDALLRWAVADGTEAPPLGPGTLAELDREFQRYVLALADSVPWTETLRPGR
ncbi:MAG TPA: hypothetical protein VMK65_12975 [Longimicrobiales bacterium]|nr:hypothetical protein [Longimicrobiales bacterium]